VTQARLRQSAGWSQRYAAGTASWQTSTAKVPQTQRSFLPQTTNTLTTKSALRSSDKQQASAIATTRKAASAQPIAKSTLTKERWSAVGEATPCCFLLIFRFFLVVVGEVFE
jgi:hypothetical protein